MKMNEIKSYDEVLDTLKNVRNYLKIARADDCVDELDKVAKYLINKNNNNPTLDECIKEWEERGFEIISHTRERFEVYKQWIERINQCSHHTSAKVVIEKDFFYIVGQFSNEYTQLLTKTLKSMEVNKND